MDLNLRGKHVLIAGASQGIGNSLARAFANEGARLSLVARRVEKLRTLYDELDGKHAGHAFCGCDLESDAQTTAAIKDIEAANGGVDICIHCPGGSLQIRDILEPVERWERVWQLNVGTSIRLANLLAPRMAAQGWGRLIFFSSSAALTLDAAPAYCAAKAYLEAYVTMLGRKFAGNGVVVCAVRPSYVVAEGNNWDRALRQDPEKVEAIIKSHLPIGRIPHAEDIVPQILFLASHHNRLSQGAIVDVQGGSY